MADSQIIDVQYRGFEDTTFYLDFLLVTLDLIAVPKVDAAPYTTVDEDFLNTVLLGTAADNTITGLDTDQDGIVDEDVLTGMLLAEEPVPTDEFNTFVE